MPRKELDGARLTADIARLATADKATPPQARPSLKDAVRQFSTFIETRAKLNWSSAAIAALLSEAGYVIDAATLRSYRSRLKAEAGAMPPGTEKPLPAPDRRPDRLLPPAREEGPAAETRSHARRAHAEPPAQAPPAVPPAGERTPRRPFRIDRSTIPSDRG